MPRLSPYGSKLISKASAPRKSGSRRKPKAKDSVEITITPDNVEAVLLAVGKIVESCKE